MKAITEFPSFVLSKGLTAKNALSKEGKTPEEISTSIGETFKFEGEKLKHFLAAIDLSSNAKDLKEIAHMCLQLQVLLNCHFPYSEPYPKWFC